MRYLFAFIILTGCSTSSKPVVWEKKCFTQAYSFVERCVEYTK